MSSLSVINKSFRSALQLFLLFALGTTRLLRPNRYSASSRIISSEVTRGFRVYCAQKEGLDGATASFLGWASREGIKAPKCEMHVFPGGLRGLQATDDIDDGEIYLQVPLRLCLTSNAYTSDDSERGESAPIVAIAAEQLEWPVRLAIRIITESRATGSLWDSYIATLPQPPHPDDENEGEAEDMTLASTLPVHWSDNALNLLEKVSPNLFEETRRTKLWREYMWNEMDEIQNRMLQQSKKGRSCLILREEFEWALDCVQTRNCRLPLEEDIEEESEEEIEMQDEGSRSELLGPCVGIDYDDEYLPTSISSNTIPSSYLHVVAPFFDLMNHNQDVRTVFELKRPKPDSFHGDANGNENENEFQEDMLTVRYEGHGVKKGDQVCLNYRNSVQDSSGFEPALTGADYLLFSYGFTSQEEEENYEVFLPQEETSRFLLADLEKSDDSVTVMAIVSALGVRLRGPFTVFSDGISGELMYAMRLLVAHEELLAGGDGSVTGSSIAEILKTTSRYDSRAMSSLERVLLEEIDELSSIREEIEIEIDRNSSHDNVAFSSLLSLNSIKIKLLNSTLRWSQTYARNLTSKQCFP